MSSFSAAVAFVVFGATTLAVTHVLLMRSFRRASDANFLLSEALFRKQRAMALWEEELRNIENRLEAKAKALRDHQLRIN